MKINRIFVKENSFNVLEKKIARFEHLVFC